MKSNQRICFKCNVPMQKTFLNYKSMQLEAQQCPKCKERIFTEELALKAAAKLEAQRLEQEYTKHPIKIGHSWGMTFPKEVTKVFNLENPKTILKLHPNLEEGKIEISLN